MSRGNKPPVRADGEALPDRTERFIELVRLWTGQSTVLDHLPSLVKAYGRWPSYGYLMWELTTRRPVILAAAIVALYRAFR
jgi:hypothetical protein